MMGLLHRTREVCCLSTPFLLVRSLPSCMAPVALLVVVRNPDFKQKPMCLVQTGSLSPGHEPMEKVPAHPPLGASS